MAIFKLGLVGAGRMGQNHLKAHASSEVVRVTAIAEPVEATRAALPSSGAVLHPSIDSMLAAGASVPLQIGFWRRFVPMLKRLRERIVGGELGSVYAIACFQWDGQPPGAYFRTHSGGIFVDMDVHEFDQTRWLSEQEFGPTRSLASGVAAEPWPGDPESAHVLAELSGGTTALISLGRRFPLGDVCKVEVFGTKDWEECRFLWPPTADATFFEALKVQAESFARHTRGAPREGAGGDDAAAALEAAQRAAFAFAPGGAIV